MSFIAGKKTFIVASIMVIVAGLHYQGFINAEIYKLIEGVLVGGCLAALRAGVAK